MKPLNVYGEGVSLPVTLWKQLWEPGDLHGIAWWWQWHRLTVVLQPQNPWPHHRGLQDFPSRPPSLTPSDSGPSTLPTLSLALLQASSPGPDSSLSFIPWFYSATNSCRFYFLTLPNSSSSPSSQLPFSPGFLQWTPNCPPYPKSKLPETQIGSITTPHKTLQWLPRCPHNKLQTLALTHVSSDPCLPLQLTSLLPDSPDHFFLGDYVPIPPWHGLKPPPLPKP